jgi:hypothetical protein
MNEASVASHSCTVECISSLRGTQQRFVRGVARGNLLNSTSSDKIATACPDFFRGPACPRKS